MLKSTFKLPYNRGVNDSLISSIIKISSVSIEKTFYFSIYQISETCNFLKCIFPLLYNSFFGSLLFLSLSLFFISKGFLGVDLSLDYFYIIMSLYYSSCKLLCLLELLLVRFSKRSKRSFQYFCLKIKTISPKWLKSLIEDLKKHFPIETSILSLFVQNFTVVGLKKVLFFIYFC